MKANVTRVCLWLLAMYLAPAQAHQMSTGYVTLSPADETVSGELQVRFYDLEQAVGLDSDGDGQLRWAEVLSHRPRLLEYLQQYLTLKQPGGTCPLQFGPDLKTTEHFNEGYLVASFAARCEHADALTLRYDLIFAEAPDHKVLVNVSGDPAVLNAQKRELPLSGQAVSGWQVVIEYLLEGVWHIWIGFDHILFLLALLLPAVLYRSKGHWVPAQNAGEAFRNTVWLVTAFTLAHSVTLTMTALGWLDFSTRWVELLIAVSILVAALNNIFPFLPKLGWITFGFGLIHGMGFASVLLTLGLDKDNALWSVLAFNVGVEVGQLAILLVLLPLLVGVRKFSWYRQYAMPFLSAVIGTMAIQWSLQRL